MTWKWLSAWFGILAGWMHSPGQGSPEPLTVAATRLSTPRWKFWPWAIRQENSNLACCPECRTDAVVFLVLSICDVLTLCCLDLRSPEFSRGALCSSIEIRLDKLVVWIPKNHKKSFGSPGRHDKFWSKDAVLSCNLNDMALETVGTSRSGSWDVRVESHFSHFVYSH